MVPIKSHPPDGELSEDTPNFSLVMDEKVEDSEVRVSESLQVEETNEEVGT